MNSKKTESLPLNLGAASRNHVLNFSWIISCTLGGAAFFIMADNGKYNFLFFDVMAG